MDNIWPYPGARWWKFDFHSHTPKSNDYGHGNTSMKSIAVEEWLQNAMQSALDCVVVTDHLLGGWIDLLKAKNFELQSAAQKPSWFRELIIFPGVEITVANSSSRIHLLAVFDPKCDGQKITSVLGACGITDGFGDDHLTSTTTGFVETVNKIKEANGIAIPAHVDGVKGLLEGIRTLTPELKKCLNAVFAAEFCNLHILDDADRTLKAEMSRLAKVAGSDAHQPGDIGKYFCWLKMGPPSIEGLHLALQDHEFCVKNQSESPNFLPDIFLSKLTIRAMRYCGRLYGQPLVIHLHPLFNAIIGGRGTGKSTLIESVRIVSRRDQDLQIEAPRIKGELDKFMMSSLNKGVMLNETEILLEVQRRGKKFQLRWRADGQDAVLEEQNTEGNWLAVETGNLRERFPVSLLSQKQINELASNPRGLLEVVDRSPEVDRAAWMTRWESVKSQFIQLRERRRSFQRQILNEAQLRSKLQDIENDLRQYEEKGHGKILNQYQKCSQQKNGMPGSDIFVTISANIRELATHVGLPDFPAYLFDADDESTDEIKSIHDQSAQSLVTIGQTLVQLAEKVDTLQLQHNQNICLSNWHVAMQSSMNAYEGLVKEYSKKQNPLSISFYGEWVAQRNQLQQQLNKLAAIRKEIVTIDKQLNDAQQVLLDMRIELTTKRQSFLDKVIGDNPYVRMELVQFGDVSTLEADYRFLLGLDAGKFISSVLDQQNKQGILFNLHQWEALNIPVSDLLSFVSTIKSETCKIAEGEVSGLHCAFDNRLAKMYETQPSVFDQLDVWWPEDLLRVKYSKDPHSGKFEDLEKGSAGQKAATILAFLLSHGSEPLVIDQPEDDLDNALIYDLIVKQIHENKNRRQLIIATHNPNIVVNGDAEMVHIMKFNSGQIQIDQQGSLEESTIREAICTIMEGGRKAFNQRYNRIFINV